jgi:coproporphyrinogen III oxidase
MSWAAACRPPPPPRAPAWPGAPGRRWGVSLVLHPRNPYCPTAHMNVRCFIARKDGEEAVWWFGGGMDLTPYYGFDEDAHHFHATCKRALSPFGDDKCIRATSSGATSISSSSTATSRAASAASSSTTSNELRLRAVVSTMTQAVGDAFPRAPTCRSRSAVRALPYAERERDFQALSARPLCRVQPGVGSRHALFGLQSGGRTESILMSHAAAGGLELPARGGRRLARSRADPALSGAARLVVRTCSRSFHEVRCG